MAYFLVHSFANSSYFVLSDLYILAISGTRGSSGLGSQSNEHIDSKTGNRMINIKEFSLQTKKYYKPKKETNNSKEKSLSKSWGGMNEGGLALNVSRSANLSSIFMYRLFFGGRGAGEERKLYLQRFCGFCDVRK